MGVDYLTAILAQLASRRFPSLHRHEGGELRVIAAAPAFEDLLAEAFDQIRASAAGNVAVMARMLGALTTLAGLTTRPRHRQALGDQARQIADLADRSLASGDDCARIKQRLVHVREALAIGQAEG
jgi:uncharacterized membrane protein